MDEESQRGREEGEAAGHVVPEPLFRSQSICSVRASYISVVEEPDECHSVSHLGILIPVYLLPLLLLGAQFGGCLYSLLLPLLLWAFNAVPKPAAALVHLVTLPLLDLMAAEHVACHYLAVEVLIVVLLLFGAMIIDAWSELVLSLAQGICARCGLRRGPLFALVCTCAFVSACLFSGLVVSVALLYFVDRVLSTIFMNDLDRTTDVSSPGILRVSHQETPSAQLVHTGDQVLFDRLAEAVLTLKKPQRRFLRRKKKSLAALAPCPAAACTATGSDENERATPTECPKEDVEAAPVVSATSMPADPALRTNEQATACESPKHDVERTDAECTVTTQRKDGRISRWRRKWLKSQRTADTTA